MVGIGGAMSGWLLVAGILLGGGGGDLLDFVSTADYWQSQHVEPTGENMLAMLTAEPGGDPAPLIRRLGAAEHAQREEAQRQLAAMGPAIVPELRKSADSPDPEVRVRVRTLLEQLEGKGSNKAVRRLMAIRALGELKHPPALPVLRKLAEAKAPFDADYARRAIAAIEGKPFAAEFPDKAFEADLWLLPGNCAVVGQVRLGGGKPVRLEELIEPMPMGGMFGGAMDAGAMQTRAREELLKSADRIGNVRLQGLTVGVSDNAGASTGAMVLVVRGLYDPAAARAALAAAGMTPEKVGKTEVLRKDKEFAVICASQERLVLLVGDDAAPMLTEVVAAVEGGKGKLTENAAMAALVRKAGRTWPVWGVARVPQAAAAEPVVGAFKTAALSSRRQEGRIDFTLKAEGEDAEKVRKAVEEANTRLADAFKDVGQIEQMLPGFKPWLDFARSIRVTADGAAATATGQFKGDVADMFKPYVSVGLMIASMEEQQKAIVQDAEGEDVVPPPAPEVPGPPEPQPIP